MAYFGNHCAIEGSATDNSGLFAHLSHGATAEDFQIYLNHFNSQTGHAMTGSRYTGPLGFAGSQSSMYNTHAIQTYPFGGQSSYTGPSQLEYQHPLAGVMEHGVPHCLSQGDALKPIQVQEKKLSPNSSTRSNKIRNKIHELHPFYSRRLASVAPQEGRTRTRDKYRVVYTEKQRVGLEKAYKEDKFITMAKKTDLSKTLDLSDRQIKIWFQNRRAKERRDGKKTSENTALSDNVSETKPSCRFEKENVSPGSPANSSDNSDFTVQNMTSPVYGIHSMSSPVYGMQDLDQYRRYEYLLPQSTNFKMGGEEVSSSPEVAHTRFQMSPSEWIDAYHQPMMNTVNVSPFTSSLDVNYLSRA